MLYSASSFPEGRFENRRTLEPRMHLDKYASGWECSQCRRRFDLNANERQAVAIYGEQIPSRILCEFNKHSCADTKTS